MEKNYHPCPGCRQFVDTSLYPQHIASNHKDGVYVPPPMEIYKLTPNPPQQQAQMPQTFPYPPQNIYPPNYAYPPQQQPAKKNILSQLNELFADTKHRKAVLALSFIMFAIGWMIRSFFTG